MPFVSYAQNFEDVLLWRAFRSEKMGFYVDVGAGHPDKDSVTRSFYDRGWQGINIEPAPAFAAMLAASRPHDLNLPVAAGTQEGTATLYLVSDTGLSTTQQHLTPDIVARGFNVREITVPVRTLTGILTEHGPPTIHFLKIDVEGSEMEVLASCDFSLFRPWIVLVEATSPMSTYPSYANWEPILTEAGYEHVFFDGLNRYYVAQEHLSRLSPYFSAPANVFDDFIRASDLTSPRFNETGEAAAVAARAAVAEASAQAAYARAFEAAREVAKMREHLGAISAHNDAMDAHIKGLTAKAAALEREAALAQHEVRQLRSSTSWRVSRPIRLVGRLLGRGKDNRGDVAMPPAAALLKQLDLVAPDAQAQGDGEAPHVRKEINRDHGQDIVPPALPVVIQSSGPLTAVHQFHSGSAVGDAITSSMLMLRGILRAMGYRSEIFVEHREPLLKHELRLLEELPLYADHVLIIRHSMGHDALDRILLSPAPKILLFHNITPPEFLASSPEIQAYARLGRSQLGLLRHHVVTALADSEYNANELRALGYSPVRACALLFDLASLERQAASRIRPTRWRPYTVLFTGRVIESKGQCDLVEAYARFRARMDRPCQLVLVGRLDAPGSYIGKLDAAMRAHGLEAEMVMTGLVSEEELHARFAEADLFLSLSQHEGFGVPLVEAIMHGLPVLAWPSSAIPYTLGDAAGLLNSRDPDLVADRMLEIALDPGRRAALVAVQRASIGRFALPLQLPALHEALAMAGAVPPAGEATRAAIRPNLRFTVTGHVTGSYSLAAVNRSLALSIEAKRPGHGRLRPVEGVLTKELSEVPERERSRIAPLVARGPAETGPEVVISQNYPVHVPAAPGAGSLLLAMMFWEESILPATTIENVSCNFHAVLAPTTVVAKALVDSGLSIPVRVTGHVPDLSAMERIGRRRGALVTGMADAERPITFLHVSSCFPRKGVDVLLAAYARAFRRGDPVRLVIKGFPNPHNTLVEDVAALRMADPDAPLIEVVNRDISGEELLALYATADAMVLPTRGEGFNLPAAEAMAAGIPLIVTGHGGHMDFCNAEIARLLRWRFAPSGSHLATPGSLWVEPDMDDLVDALRETTVALRTPAGRVALAERVRGARLQVAQQLLRAPLVQRLEDTALDILLAPPQPPLRVAWVTSWEVPCGVAEYTRQLVQAMPANAAIGSHSILPDERWQAGSDTADAPGNGVRPCWRIGDPGSLPRLAAAVVAEDPHVVVLQHQPGLVSWDGLRDLLDDPAVRDRIVVVTLHNTQHLLEQEEPVRRSVRDALGRADRLLVHAVADLERLREVGLSGNVALLPHGVKAPSPATLVEPEGPRTIGCYGFFLPAKGIAELIQALAILRRSHPDLRLRLVNATYDTPLSTDEIARCRAVAEEEGVASAIDWHTTFLPEDEFLSLLGGCTVIMLPYQASKESSSASMRDAMAAGPPVVVTPIGIFDEAEDAVWRTRGVDPQSLADALDALLADAPARDRLRKAARDWLSARSWSIVARRLQGMIIGLAATRHLEAYQPGRSPDVNLQIS